MCKSVPICLLQVSSILKPYAERLPQVGLSPRRCKQRFLTLHGTGWQVQVKVMSRLSCQQQQGTTSPSSCSYVEQEALSKVTLKAFGSTPSVQVHVPCSSPTGQHSPEQHKGSLLMDRSAASSCDPWNLLTPKNPTLQGGKGGNVQRTVQE